MRLVSFLVALVAATGAYGSEPAAPTIEILRARAHERMRQDLTTYSPEELRKLEELYQSANGSLAGADAKATLERVVEEYPESDRAGCAVLYLAQFSSGAEREAYLRTAIDEHGDAWYGDGVQVGALARAQLAALYAAEGRTAQAEALAKEVADRFPGAVDHGGRRLADVLGETLALSGDETAGEAPEISVSALPPVVVRTVPASGDLAVDPSLAEISVTFSKEMRGGWSWVRLSEETFPEITGRIRYLPDDRTCVAPVTLEPNRTYAISLNSARFTNFKDASGNAALPYLLVFRTRD